MPGRPTRRRRHAAARRTAYLAAARAAHQASLDICVRLAADPANTQWQHDLSIIRQKIEDLDNSAEEA